MNIPVLNSKLRAANLGMIDSVIKKTIKRKDKSIAASSFFLYLHCVKNTH